MKRENNIQISLSMLILGFVLSCNKLNTKVYDQVTNFWRSPEQIAAGVAPAYSGLRDYAPTNSIYCINEVSTDEIIVPNRVHDWADNVVWRDLWKHTWGANNEQISGAWQVIYGGISRVNNIMQAVNTVDPKPVDIASIQAELKIVRAFYNFQALDLFGNAPIFDDNNITDLSKLGTKPRTEVFAYVEKELKDNIPALTNEVNPKTYGRATQYLAQAILAKLYLNAFVYTSIPRWRDCINACDEILNSGKYELESNFFDNFKIDNELSKETIFAIPFDIKAGLDAFWLQGATLHYNSDATFGLPVGGFNGFCSTAEYYSLFDVNDTRRKMFLVGQQYINQISDSAHLQYDRFHHPLIFDPVITTFILQDPKTETAGARCAKWEFNKETIWGNMSNDFAVFRLADIILMKSEAQFRNGDVNAALTTINEKINGVSIRSRTGLPDFSASEMNLEGLLKERARELSWEGWRRNDLIRFGHFTDARIPEKGVSQSFRTLYPIPEAELAKNPYLVQNPGY